METPALARPTLAPRTRPVRRALVHLAAAAAGAGAVGLAMLAISNPTAPAPLDLSVAQIAPVPAPFLVSETLPPPTPTRALAPWVEGACPSPEVCTWDDGFPAIAADGTTIATVARDSDPTGRSAVVIDLIDVKTSRRVGGWTYTVTEGDDVLPEADPAAEAARVAKLAATKARAIAEAQGALDARGFRAMQELAIRDTNAAGPDAQPMPATVHLEIRDRAIRFVDPDAIGGPLARWQHQFASHARESSEDLCASDSTRRITAAWDPQTHQLIATRTYDTGGCMCSTLTESVVRRIP